MGFIEVQCVKFNSIRTVNCLQNLGNVENLDKLEMLSRMKAIKFLALKICFWSSLPMVLTDNA